MFGKEEAWPKVVYIFKKYPGGFSCPQMAVCLRGSQSGEPEALCSVLEPGGSI